MILQNICMNICLFVLFSSYQAYTILYEKNFSGQTLGCHSELPEGWTNQDFTFANDCDGTCYFEPTSTNIASVLKLSQDSIKFNYILPIGTPVFSQIGVDITFLAINHPTIQLNLNNITISMTSDPIDQTTYEETEQLNCGTGTPYQFSYGRVKFMNTTDLLSNNITLEITKQAIGQEVGVRSIRLWSNCGNNCGTCYNSTECSGCLNGFSLQKTSTDERRCTQSHDCQSIMPNCYVCVYKNATWTCIYCAIGYAFSSGTNSCVLKSTAIACRSSGFDYQDDNGVCQLYSTKAYYSDKSGQLVHYTGPYDLKNYNCDVRQLALIFDRFNYNSYRCACNIGNCQACSDELTCDVCYIEYDLINSNTKCQYKCAPYYCFDYTTVSCLPCKPHCSYGLGLSCRTCDSGYYVDPLHPQYCIPCQVSNCTACVTSPSANPYQCQTCDVGLLHFTDASNTQYCIPCQVANCSACVTSPSDNAYSCQTCQPGYYHYTDVNNIESCIPCQVNNCTACVTSPSDNPYQCETCQNGYLHYTDVNNVQTCIPCQVSNCSTCVTNPFDNPYSCEICQAGYLHYTDANNVEKCIPCQVNKCAVCVSSPTDNPYQCETCINDFALNLITFGCDQIYPDNIATSSIELFQSGYYLTLTFSTNIVPDSSYDILNLLDISISDSTVIPHKITEINSNSVKVTVSPEFTLRKQTLTTQFKNTYFIEKNHMKPTSSSIGLPDFNYISPSQQQAVSVADSVGSAATTTVVATLIPTVLVSNFYILINTIDLTGFLYYLLFVKIRFPANILVFYEAFKNFQFPFIPNFFDQFLDGEYHQTAPTKFEENGTSLLFISNSGQSVTIFFFIILVYLVGKALSKMKIPKVSPYLQTSMKMTWEYNSFFDLLWTLYIYLVVGALLQFYCFDFDYSLAPLNYTIHFLFAIIVISSPLLVLFILYRQKDIQTNKLFSIQFGTLIGGVRLFNEMPEERTSEKVIKMNDDSPPQEQYNDKDVSFMNDQTDESVTQLKRVKYQQRFTKLYIGILYLRKLLFAILIVFLYDDPYYQLTLISVLNALVAFYIFYIQPLQKFQDNIRNGVGEIILIIVQSCGYFLIEDDETYSEDERMNVGWIIIGLSSFILLWNTLLIILETFGSLVSLIKSKCKKGNSNKVQNFEEPKTQSQLQIKETQIIQHEDDFMIQSIQSPEIKSLATNSVYTSNLKLIQSQRHRKSRFEPQNQQNNRLQIKDVKTADSSFIYDSKEYQIKESTFKQQNVQMSESQKDQIIDIDVGPF